jgi:hypothetical protein
MSPIEKALADIVAKTADLAAETAIAQQKFSVFVVERLPAVPADEKQAILSAAQKAEQNVQKFRQQIKSLQDALK